MEFKGTKGKWVAEEPSGKGCWVGNDNGWAALSCGNTDKEAIANAQLISKAPEMLDRLESLSNMVIRKCNLNNDAELKDLLKEVQAARQLIQSAIEL